MDDWKKNKAEAIEGLKKLREPFKEHQIGLLPKPYKKDSRKGHCKECGGYHGLPAAHLQFVGHAALTDRLLEVDPFWNWEPVTMDENGLPFIDKQGGMWIKLTILGVTRLGYGNAHTSKGPDGVKEVIGDALRNAAMRFGAALELWHKGTLHGDETEKKKPKKQAPKKKEPAGISAWIDWLDQFCTRTSEELEKALKVQSKTIDSFSEKDRAEFNSYLRQVRDVLSEKGVAPETIDCPEGGEVTEVDCGECEKKPQCKKHGNGSKLNMKI